MNRNLLKSMLTAVMLALGMSLQAKEDVTDLYLLNADLSLDPIVEGNGWLLGNNWRQDYQMAQDKDHVNVVEFYSGWDALANKEYSMKQSVTLPAGDYRLAVNAFYRQGNSGNGTNNNMAWIFAGEKKQNVYALKSQSELSSFTGSSDLWKASNAFLQGKYSNEFDFTVTEETTIELGFEGTFDEMRSWVILGPVKLYKYTLEDYLVDYRAKVAEAQSYLTQKMSADVLAVLNAAIVDESTLTSSAAIADAIQTLNEAINAAQLSIAGYARLKAALDEGDAFIATSLEYGAPESCKTALDEIRTGYENGTIADADIDQKIAEIKPILLSVAKQQTKAGADMTVLLTNSDFELNASMAEGWTTEHVDGGNVNIGGNSLNHCFEAWNNGSFDIYQTVENAPYGVYEIQVQGFYRYLRDDNAWNAYQAQEVDYVKKQGVPVYVYMNDNATPFTNVFAENPVPNGELYTTDASLLNPGNIPPYVEPSQQYWYPNEMYNTAVAFSNGMYRQSAFGLVAFEGDVLRLGVKGASNQGNDSWAIWDDFKLIYRGFQADVIKPVLEEAVADVENTYLGLLMGKTEYAAFTNAIADAEKAIADNDGEAMFKALRDLYAAKDPALASKDIFLSNEVAADTTRLAQAIRDVAGAKMANKTRKAANDLLYGLQNNLIYENGEIEQLKADVTDMISSLNYSVSLYSSMNDEAATLKNAIDDIKAELPQMKLIAEAEKLYSTAISYYNSGDLDDDQVPAFIEVMQNMRQLLSNTTASYNQLKGALDNLKETIDAAKGEDVPDSDINAATSVLDAGTAVYNAGELGYNDVNNEIDKVNKAISDLMNAINIATRISNVNTNAAEGPVYNMGGQKVKSAKKGLLIKNGQKVVKK